MIVGTYMKGSPNAGFDSWFQKCFHKPRTNESDEKYLRRAQRAQKPKSKELKKSHKTVIVQNGSYKKPIKGASSVWARLDQIFIGVNNWRNKVRVLRTFSSLYEWKQ